MAIDAPPPSQGGCWLLEGQRLTQEGDVRVTSAFNRLLRLPGASVVDVGFGTEGVIVTVRLRRRRRVCSECGQTGRHLEVHDRRVKRWRHLDLGCTRCIVECELRRLRCPDCGVRLEPVAWARPGPARRTRAASRTPRRGWRSRWPLRRSRGCCGSGGAPSARSSNASAPSSLTTAGLRAWFASAWTRSATGAITAT